MNPNMYNQNLPFLKQLKETKNKVNSLLMMIFLTIIFVIIGVLIFFFVIKDSNNNLIQQPNITSSPLIGQLDYDDSMLNYPQPDPSYMVPEEITIPPQGITMPPVYTPIVTPGNTNNATPNNTNEPQFCLNGTTSSSGHVCCNNLCIPRGTPPVGQVHVPVCGGYGCNLLQAGGQNCCQNTILNRLSITHPSRSLCYINNENFNICENSEDVGCIIPDSNGNPLHIESDECGFEFCDDNSQFCYYNIIIEIIDNQNVDDLLDINGNVGTLKDNFKIRVNLGHDNIQYYDLSNASFYLFKNKWFFDFKTLYSNQPDFSKPINKLFSYGSQSNLDPSTLPYSDVIQILDNEQVTYNMPNLKLYFFKDNYNDTTSIPAM